MKKWLIGLCVVAAIGGASVAYCWDEIEEIQALREYAALFEADAIDENFRTLHAQYPSVTIKRGGPVYELPVALRDDAMPTRFTASYDGQSEDLDLRAYLEDTHTTGLAIMLGDELIYESYARGNTRESKAIMMSVSKSMASFLIGKAIDDGLIKSVDDSVIQYAPSLKGTAYDDGVTVKNVLEMSSGVRWDEDYGRLDSDLVQSVVAMRLGSLDEFTRQVPRENEPGSFNRYASIDTHALGMILRGATGQSYEDYFRDKLWSKIGAEDDAEMLVDSMGQPLVYGGVNIRLRDMIRFGKMWMDQGRNHLGEQIVSANWVATATKPDGPHLLPGIDNPRSDAAFGYKYQWWVPLEPDNDDFSAIGIYGQFIYINPARRVIIAKTSAYPDYTVDGGLMNHKTMMMFQAIARHLSPDATRAQDLVD